MRGEFRFKSGLVVPNNITVAGREFILRGAFNGSAGVTPLPGGNFVVGLCKASPSDSLTVAQIVEPAGNGYARVNVSRDLLGWPTVGTSGGEPYIESKDLVFAADGGPFNVAVTRLFLAESNTLLALSSAFPAELLIQPTTPLADRTFNYRVYAR